MVVQKMLSMVLAFSAAIVVRSDDNIVSHQNDGDHANAAKHDQTPLTHKSTDDVEPSSLEVARNKAIFEGINTSNVANTVARQLQSGSATDQVFSYYYSKTSCTGTANHAYRTPAHLDMCANIFNGKCLIMPSPAIPDRMRYMKWVVDQTNQQFYTGWYDWTGSGCGAGSVLNFVDVFSNAESIKLLRGDCACGYYCSGSRRRSWGCGPGSQTTQCVRMDPGCSAGVSSGGTCSSCVKNGVSGTIQSQCKQGAKNAVQSVIQNNVGAIGSVIANTIVGELDTLTLQSLGSQTASQACADCITAIANWLASTSPSTCTGGSSCYGVDFIAGMSMTSLQVSSLCTSAVQAASPSPTPSTQSSPRRRSYSPSPTPSSQTSGACSSINLLSSFAVAFVASRLME